MNRILSWTDLKPFAGQIIAFKTESHYLGANRGFFEELRNNLKYGYVPQKPAFWGSEGSGYAIKKLLSPAEKPNLSGITDSTLLTESISVRSTTDWERTQIILLVWKQRALFEYDPQELLLVINRLKVQ